MKVLLKAYFWRLACYDPQLLASCSEKERKLALVSGVFLLILFVLILCSCLYLSLLLLHAYYLALIVGPLIAFTLISLFRFLLSSLLSYRLPELHRNSKTYFSWAIRLTYLLFLVLFVAKPIELFVFQGRLNEDLMLHRQHKADEFKERIARQIGKERSDLEQELQTIASRLSEAPSNDIYGDRRDRLKERILLLDQREQELLDSFIKQNEKAAYFIPRLVFLHENYPVSWLITLGVGAFFILPVIIEIKKKKESHYQLKCDDVDLTLILSQYHKFLRAYRAVFKTEYGVRIEYEENFKNPPFNTIPKQAPEVIRDKDLLLKHLKQ